MADSQTGQGTQIVMLGGGEGRKQNDRERVRSEWEQKRETKLIIHFMSSC